MLATYQLITGDSHYMWGFFPVNHCIYKKCIKQEMYNMPMDFLSDTLWPALICCAQNLISGIKTVKPHMQLCKPVWQSLP